VVCVWGCSESADQRRETSIPSRNAGQGCGLERNPVARGGLVVVVVVKRTPPARTSGIAPPSSIPPGHCRSRSHSVGLCLEPGKTRWCPGIQQRVPPGSTGGGGQVDSRIHQGIAHAGALAGTTHLETRRRGDALFVPHPLPAAEHNNGNRNRNHGTRWKLLQSTQQQQQQCCHAAAASVGTTAQAFVRENHCGCTVHARYTHDPVR